MEEQGREARRAQIKIEIEGSQAQQGKKIEVKGQIERESAKEEKRLVGLVGGLYEGLIIQRVLFTP